MAIGLRRKLRLDSRRENQKITRTDNGGAKRKENARRDIRSARAITAMKGDYSSGVKSWIARQLGKPFRQCTAEYIKGLAR